MAYQEEGVQGSMFCMLDTSVLVNLIQGSKCEDGKKLESFLQGLPEEFVAFVTPATLSELENLGVKGEKLSDAQRQALEGELEFYCNRDRMKQLKEQLDHVYNVDMTVDGDASSVLSSIEFRKNHSSAGVIVLTDDKGLVWRCQTEYGVLAMTIKKALDLYQERKKDLFHHARDSRQDSLQLLEISERSLKRYKELDLYEDVDISGWRRIEVQREQKKRMIAAAAVCAEGIKSQVLWTRLMLYETLFTFESLLPILCNSFLDNDVTLAAASVTTMDSMCDAFRAECDQLMTVADNLEQMVQKLRDETKGKILSTRSLKRRLSA